jgi:hypothetical protein
MKVLPKLSAALVACAAFMLATNGAWANEIPMEKISKKGAGKHEATAPANSRTEVGVTSGGGGSGKAGSTTSANKMGKASGKQPRKEAPTKYKDPSVSTGVSRGEAAGKHETNKISETQPAGYNPSGFHNKLATQGSKKSGNSANAVSSEIQIPKK